MSRVTETLYLFYARPFETLAREAVYGFHLFPQLWLSIVLGLWQGLHLRVPDLIKLARTGIARCGSFRLTFKYRPVQAFHDMGFHAITFPFMLHHESNCCMHDRFLQAQTSTQLLQVRLSSMVAGRVLTEVLSNTKHTQQPFLRGQP